MQPGVDGEAVFANVGGDVVICAFEVEDFRRQSLEEGDGLAFSATEFGNQAGEGGVDVYDRFDKFVVVAGPVVEKRAFEGVDDPDLDGAFGGDDVGEDFFAVPLGFGGAIFRFFFGDAF